MHWSLGDTFRVHSITPDQRQAALAGAPHTTLCPDLIPYQLLGAMNDCPFNVLIHFYNLLLSECTVKILHHSDFAPKKEPHGIVANGRPLSHLSVLWKLLSNLFYEGFVTMAGEWRQNSPFPHGNAR